ERTIATPLDVSRHARPITPSAVSTSVWETSDGTAVGIARLQTGNAPTYPILPLCTKHEHMVGQKSRIDRPLPLAPKAGFGLRRLSHSRQKSAAIGIDVIVPELSAAS